MRHIICYEGDEKVPNQYITKNALTWVDKTIPVLSRFGDGELIALATDIRREDDGALTAEIKLIDGNEVPKDMTVSIQMFDVDYHTWEEVLWITKGEIRQMALIPEMWWPHHV